MLIYHVSCLVRYKPVEPDLTRSYLILAAKTNLPQST